MEVNKSGPTKMDNALLPSKIGTCEILMSNNGYIVREAGEDTRYKITSTWVFNTPEALATWIKNNIQKPQE